MARFKSLLLLIVFDFLEGVFVAPVPGCDGRAVASVAVSLLSAGRAACMPTGAVTEVSMFDKDRKKKANASAVSKKNKRGSRFLFFFFRYVS